MKIEGSSSSLGSNYSDFSSLNTGKGFSRKVERFAQKNPSVLSAAKILFLFTMLNPSARLTRGTGGPDYTPNVSCPSFSSTLMPYGGSSSYDMPPINDTGVQLTNAPVLDISQLNTFLYFEPTVAANLIANTTLEECGFSEAPDKITENEFYEPVTSGGKRISVIFRANAEESNEARIDVKADDTCLSESANTSLPINLFWNEDDSPIIRYDSTTGPKVNGESKWGMADHIAEVIGFFVLSVVPFLAGGVMGPNRY